MFEFPEALARQVKTPQQLARELKPAWRAYTGAKRIPCDECLRILHEAEGCGPLPAATRHIRTVKATGHSAYLCEDHAKPLKAADQPKKPARARRR